MTEAKTKQPAKWRERVEPLFKHFMALNARCTWEGYVSLDFDNPKQKDLLIQHWVVPHDEGPPSYYVVRIFTSGPCEGGWEVYAPVDTTGLVEETLAAIK